MGHRFRFSATWRDAAVRKVARLMLPAAIGTAAVQVNILLITRFAWALGDGPVTYLNFAFRVLFVPLGVFAVAAATVGLPRLSERVAAGDREGVRDIYSQALSSVLYLVTPVAVAFALLGEPICGALFERGAFDSAATAHTARALGFYALGLPAMAAVRVTAPLFFAHADTRTPMICGVSSVVFNLGLMSLLVGPMGFAGLALSVASSAVLQIGLLIAWAWRRYDGLPFRALAGHFLAFAAVAWLAVRSGMWFYDLVSPALEFAGHIGHAIVAVGAAALIYLAVTWLLGYRQLGGVRTPLGRPRT
jgi:putative peptidoglycan lipid II flippase